MTSIPLRITALLSETIAAIPPDARDWERRMEQAIARGHTAAWIAGTAERSFGGRVREFASRFVGARALSTSDQRELSALVARQMDYLRGFAGAREGMSEAAIRARAQLYAGATQGTYYQARWGNWELPWVPGDGSSECVSNCRCSASVADNGDGTGIYTWVLGAGEKHCTTCPARAGDHPVKRRVA